MRSPRMLLLFAFAVLLGAAARPPVPTPKICQCSFDSQCRPRCPAGTIPVCECVCDCL